jgi:hypothetical protein
LLEEQHADPETDEQQRYELEGYCHHRGSSLQKRNPNTAPAPTTQPTIKNASLIVTSAPAK